MKTLRLLPFALCLLLFSCTEEIDITLRAGDVRLVVEGGIGIDTTSHRVVLSRTTSFFEEPEVPLYVEGATVTITEFDENMQETGRIFRLTETRPGHYYTDDTVFGIQRHTYRLTIVLNENIGGHTTYTADAFFPPIADRIDSIQAFWGTNMLWMLFGVNPDVTGRTGWNIRLWATDPPGQNFYIFVTSKNGVALNDTLTRFLMLDNTMIAQPEIGLTGVPIAFIPDDSPNAVSPGDTLGLEIRGISAEYYRWISEFRDIYSGQNPMFGGAPANIRGNISGGAIGFFWAHGNRRAYVVAGQSEQ